MKENLPFISQIIDFIKAHNWKSAFFSLLVLTIVGLVYFLNLASNLSADKSALANANNQLESENKIFRDKLSNVL